MSSQGHFSESTFGFLRELAKNNNREWFSTNKARFEGDVREPAIRFILDFAPLLKAISPHFKADPRGNGGSLFRIYRDTRFSKDKSPFKTHAGIQFRHDLGKDAHAPGYYLHIEPDGCFIGVGTWRPDGKALLKIREGLGENPSLWEAAVSHPPFRERFQLTGESLVRPPRGFDPNHPLIEDLKRKDFIAISPLADSEVTDPAFIESFASACRAGTPFMAFLCRTLEAPF
jgi:uncharacterized protein (TIGR02453 family)